MTAVALAVAGSASALTDLAELVAHRQPRSVVRILVRDGRVAVLAATPFDVLVLRAAELSGAQPDLDRVVEAVTFAATSTTGPAGDADRMLALPAAVDPLRWTWPLPPRSGWARQPDVPVIALRSARDAAVSAFRTAAQALPGPARDRPTLERIAAELWAGEISPGVDVRMAHAAAAHGFLPPEDSRPDDESSHGNSTHPVTHARVSTRGPWRRLDLPTGSVLARRGGLVLRG